MTTAAISAPLSTKVTGAEKKRFVETCDAIGTSPSNALHMFVSAFNRRGGGSFLARRIQMASPVKPLQQWTMR